MTERWEEIANQLGRYDPPAHDEPGYGLYRMELDNDGDWVDAEAAGKRIAELEGLLAEMVENERAREMAYMGLLALAEAKDSQSA